jgi:hypothetical protein
MEKFKEKKPEKPEKEEKELTYRDVLKKLGIETAIELEKPERWKIKVPGLKFELYGGIKGQELYDDEGRWKMYNVIAEIEGEPYFWYDSEGNEKAEITKKIMEIIEKAEKK